MAKDKTVQDTINGHFKSGTRQGEQYVAWVKQKLQSALADIENAEKRMAESMDADESMTYNMGNTAHVVRTAQESLSSMRETTGTRRARDDFMSSYTIVEIMEDIVEDSKGDNERFVMVDGQPHLKIG